MLQDHYHGDAQRKYIKTMWWIRGVGGAGVVEGNPDGTDTDANGSADKLPGLSLTMFASPILFSMCSMGLLFFARPFGLAPRAAAPNAMDVERDVTFPIMSVM